VASDITGATGNEDWDFTHATALAEAAGQFNEGEKPAWFASRAQPHYQPPPTPNHH